MVDPLDGPDGTPEPNLIALAKEGTSTSATTSSSTPAAWARWWARTPRRRSASRPATIRLPASPATVSAAFPWARSATPIEGGANGHTAQKIFQTSPQSWSETDLKGLFSKEKDKKPTAMDTDKGDTPGPISLAAGVSASAARRRRRVARPAAAGNTRRRRRRQRLPVERRRRRARQSGSRPQHGQLARAAGKHDRQSGRSRRRTGR